MAERVQTEQDLATLNQMAASATQSLTQPPTLQPSDLPQQILAVSSAFISLANLPKAKTCDTAVRAAFKAVTNIENQEKKPDFNIQSLTVAVTSATEMRQQSCVSLPPQAVRISPTEMLDVGATIMMRGAAEINANPNGYELGVALCDFGAQIASEVEHHPQVSQLNPQAMGRTKIAFGACLKNMNQQQPGAPAAKGKNGPSF